MSMLNRRHLMTLALTGAVGKTYAQFGSGEVRIVVPFSAGGSTDILARMYAEQLRHAIGATVVVDNKPGAGGLIGVQAVKNAPADGKTLLINNTAFIQGAILNKAANYDPIKDFVAVSHLAQSPVALAVPASFKIDSLPELIRWVKASGKPHSYGNAGVGQTTHFYGELLNKATGMNLVYVPYKGEMPFVTDLIAGHVSMGFATVSTMLPHIESGRLVALAVPGTARSPQLPNVPTLAELGFKGFEAVGWFGLLAPAGTPPAVVQRLNEVANQMLADRAMLKKLDELSLPPVGGTAQEFRETVRKDFAAWTNMVATAQIKLP